MGTQSGTNLIDKFTNCLLVRCPPELLDTLLNTLVIEIQSNVPGIKNLLLLLKKIFLTLFLGFFRPQRRSEIGCSAIRSFDNANFCRTQR